MKHGGLSKIKMQRNSLRFNDIIAEDDWNVQLYPFDVTIARLVVILLWELIDSNCVHIIALSLLLLLLR